MGLLWHDPIRSLDPLSILAAGQPWDLEPKCNSQPSCHSCSDFGQVPAHFWPPVCLEMKDGWGGGCSFIPDIPWAPQVELLGEGPTPLT